MVYASVENANGIVQVQYLSLLPTVFGLYDLFKYLYVMKSNKQLLFLCGFACGVYW